MAQTVEPKRVDQNVDTVEVRDDICYISGEYLSAAATMVAWQFIDDNATKYASVDEFDDRLVYQIRQHCPMAYSYFFQKAADQGLVPYGLRQIVLEQILKHKPNFLGGLEDDKPKIILPR